MKCEKCGKKINIVNKPLKREKWPIHYRVKFAPEKQGEFLRAFAKANNVTVEDLRGKSQEANITLPRHVAMWFLYENSHLTLANIGAYFNRDHSAVLSAVRKVSELKFKEDKRAKYTLEVCAEAALHTWPAFEKVNKAKATK